MVLNIGRFARLGEEENARHWLELALEHGVFPAVDHVRTDPDLESLREASWFEELLGKAEGDKSDMVEE